MSLTPTVPIAACPDGPSALQRCLCNSTLQRFVRFPAQPALFQQSLTFFPHLRSLIQTLGNSSGLLCEASFARTLGYSWKCYRSKGNQRNTAGEEDNANGLPIPTQTEVSVLLTSSLSTPPMASFEEVTGSTGASRARDLYSQTAVATALPLYLSGLLI